MTTPAASGRCDPQLERDTVMVGDLPLARVAGHERRQLSLAHAGAAPLRAPCEIIDLDDEQQAQLMDEIAMLSRVLKDVTACDKLNVAAIGNVVSQLHVHVVARRRDDPAWPRPVWGARPPAPTARTSSTASSTASGGRLHSVERACCARHPAVPASRAPPEQFMPFRPDLGPKPRLGYTQSLIERAAERRNDAAALAALESDPRAGVYVDRRRDGRAEEARRRCTIRCSRRRRRARCRDPARPCSSA